MGPANLFRPRILIVDDNPEDLRSLSAILDRRGYEVRTCASYQEGATLVGAHPFDFVVVSQGGPNFEGQAVIKQTLNRHTPVLVVTRCIEMACYLEAMQMGALDYLEKPIPVDFLLREIETHLQQYVA
jgi:two-component system, sensor histidine kinase and response regulator